MKFPSLRLLTRRRTTRMAAVLCLSTWTAGCAEQAIVNSTGPQYEIVQGGKVMRGHVKVFDSAGQPVDLGEVVSSNLKAARLVAEAAPVTNQALMYDGAPVKVNELRMDTLPDGSRELRVRGDLLVKIAGDDNRRDLTLYDHGVVRVQASLTGELPGTAAGNVLEGDCMPQSGLCDEFPDEWIEGMDLEGLTCWKLLGLLAAAGITAGAKCLVALASITNAAACVLAIGGIDALIDKLQEGECFPYYDPRPCLWYMHYNGAPSAQACL